MMRDRYLTHQRAIMIDKALDALAALMDGIRTGKVPTIEELDGEYTAALCLGAVALGPMARGDQT